MNKKYTVIIALLLTIAFILVALSGCGGNKNGGSLSNIFGDNDKTNQNENGGELNGQSPSTPQPDGDENNNDVSGDKETILTYKREGDYIYFGEYPNTIKSKSVTVGETTDSRGYYLGSDGYYYAKVISDPETLQYKFSNGEYIEKGIEYYFKVEPIKWKILSEKNGTALLICDSIISTMAFDKVVAGKANSNDYAESDVRAWLNEQFYNTAFTAIQQELIITTRVDNSPESAGLDANVNTCEDTDDNVFLLSYSEIVNSDYGFSSDRDQKDSGRVKRASDYSRALGVWTSSANEGIGFWYLRSPSIDSNGYKNRIVTIDEEGACNTYAFVSYTRSGVVPALQIRL